MSYNINLIRVYCRVYKKGTVLKLNVHAKLKIPKICGSFMLLCSAGLSWLLTFPGPGANYESRKTILRAGHKMRIRPWLWKGPNSPARSDIWNSY
jgi:hypothetical protein